MFRSILQPFYTTYVVLIFVATLLIVLPFYLLLSIPNSPKSRKMIWRVTQIWAKIWLRLTLMSVKVAGEVPKDKKYIVIANHISYLDPIVIYDVLPFFFRPLAKYELSKVPVFGFVYAQIALLVDRGSAAKRAKSMMQMHTTLVNECSIFMYPEGTFNETNEPMKSFYDGAFKLSIDTQTDILPIIFPDTVKRWHYSAWWKIWPGKNRAFVLNPIKVEGFKIEDVTKLKEEIRELMSKHMQSLQ